MAKSVVIKKKSSNENNTKKPRIRLKKSARRSIAAILMITAIGVAAIPVPETEAGKRDPSAVAPTIAITYPETKISDESDPDYPAKSDLIATVPCSTLNKPTNDEDILPSYAVNQIDGVWTFNWQFKYWTKVEESADMGIICEYNNTYNQEKVDLPAFIFTGYKRITKAKYDEYFNNASDDTPAGHADDFYSITTPNLDASDPDLLFLKKYYPQSFAKFTEEWTAYQSLEKPILVDNEDYIAWSTSAVYKKENLSTGVWYPCLTKYVSELPSDTEIDKAAQIYYCEQNHMMDCYLETVYDYTVTSPEPNECYYARKINFTTPIEGLDSYNQRYDNSGFLVTDITPILGIGNGAFKATRNVKYLNLSDKIKYIGAEAFQNSFIKSISFSNVTSIGDRAFKGCTQLDSITWGDPIVKIGTEAFYGTQVSSLTFPVNLVQIGPGAFAFCQRLTTIDFSKVNTLGVRLDDFAFYDCIGLSNLTLSDNINTIGMSCFAAESGLTGGFSDFVFPKNITDCKNQKYNDAATNYTNPVSVEKIGLGDLIFAGRSNLVNVTMPNSYGKNKAVNVPDNMFYGCTQLACVEFPDDGADSCQKASYNMDTLFTSVNNPDFYVKGPKLQSDNTTAAKPRECTWDAWTRCADYVPYVYYEGGVEYYEICVTSATGAEYLMCVDQNGALISCISREAPTTDLTLTIPSKVGNRSVLSIASGAFSDNALNQHVKKLIIQDNSISDISDNVFREWMKLEQVYIGNSVSSIGNYAFYNCERLTDVTFATPLAGYENFSIGTDAFSKLASSTGAKSEMTFHGDIASPYAPFDYAMNPSNMVKPTSGINVCYKSLAPSYLSIMADSSTGLVTLIDYPKYEDVNNLLDASYQSQYDMNYNDYMEYYYYSYYGTEDYNSSRATFANAWKAYVDGTRADDPMEDFTIYGPWVTETFVQEIKNGTYTYASANDSEGFFDFLFEPLVVYAASNDDLKAYFDKYPYDVIEAYEYGQDRSHTIYGTYQYVTTDVEELIDCTKNLVVPDCVQSIDVAKFIAGNVNNATVYLSDVTGKVSHKTYDMDHKSSTSGTRTDYDFVTGGLFSGEYEDYNVSSPDRTLYESMTKGNDRLESITLPGITSLPDYAFDSCEKLTKVVIGNNCSEIGEMPFRGCKNLASLTIDDSNEYFVADNNILYFKDDDGSYGILECLEGRGNDGTSAVVSSANDPLIMNVDYISPYAFSECEGVKTVDITDAGCNLEDTALKEIPVACFKNCTSMNTLKLPSSVNYIMKEVFAGDGVLQTLRIPGREVEISAVAFDDLATTPKPLTTVFTMDDSAAYRYVLENGEKYNLDYECIGDYWTVTFLDMDGSQIGKSLSVEDGDSVPKSSRPADPTQTGYTFRKWLGTGQIDVDDAIYQDTIFVAQYTSNSGMIDGKYVIKFLDGIDGSVLSTQYVLPGEDAISPTTPTHAGYTFLKWSDDCTAVSESKDIVALYSAATTSGQSTSSQATSSSSTSSQSTSSKSTSQKSSSSSSTSSTSSSSTSTTSTTSVSKYTVTVINGAGSGSYDVGSTVVIAAIEQTGKVFTKWTTESNGVNLASVSMTATTFTMPANNVTITANFTDQAANTVAPAKEGTKAKNDGSTRVDIIKPGISNKDLATANVNGSTDNFVVKITETDAATQAVAAALLDKYGTLDNILYYAMDITLYDETGTTQITNTQGLSIDITIPIPDALINYGGNNNAGAVINGNKLEELGEKFTSVNGVPCITFTATHFSPYTIYVDVNNLSEGTIDVTPKTGDPIHPKWFLAVGLAALSAILFLKKDKKTTQANA